MIQLVGLLVACHVVGLVVNATIHVGDVVLG